MVGRQYGLVDKNEKEFEMAIVNTANAFSRSLYQGIIVIDYTRQKFVFASGNFEFLCGLSAAEVCKMGYGFYYECIMSPDLEILLRARPKWKELVASLSPEQCMDYSLHFDFRFKKDNGAYMVHHTFTTLSLTAEGRPHLLLCTISLSSQISCGHVIMLNRNSRKYMEYNDGTDRWERGELPLLTEHERCILYLSTWGNTVPCIARKLCKSENTVKTCKRKLFQKLGVNSISAAISYAANYQLL